MDHLMKGLPIKGQTKGMKDTQVPEITDVAVQDMQPVNQELSQMKIPTIRNKEKVNIPKGDRRGGKLEAHTTVHRAYRKGQTRKVHVYRVRAINGLIDD